MFQRLLAHSDAEGYAQTAMALADASAADVAPRVRVPCLCVTGTEDRYAPPAAVRAFADSISVAVYEEIMDCGHMPFFEAPDRFSAIVQGFLREMNDEAPRG
jgi:pimeloyl-ACP methyl ester carboxylesterase